MAVGQKRGQELVVNLQQIIWWLKKPVSEFIIFFPANVYIWPSFSRWGPWACMVSLSEGHTDQEVRNRGFMHARGDPESDYLEDKMHGRSWGCLSRFVPGTVATAVGSYENRKRVVVYMTTFTSMVLVPSALELPAHLLLLRNHHLTKSLVRYLLAGCSDHGCAVFSDLCCRQVWSFRVARWVHVCVQPDSSGDCDSWQDMSST
jgi:hypothetical protein